MRWDPLGVGIALVLAYVVLRGTDLIAIGAFNDDGVYAALGRAIARGEGYRLTYLPGSPVAVKYPPGLPALLAIPWLLGGGIPGLRALIGIVQPVICGAAAAILWWLGRRRLEVSPVVAGVLVIGPFLLDAAIVYYSIPIAEPYLIAGWATVLLLVDRLARHPPETVATRPAIALGLTLAVTALFRSAGLVLLPAVLISLALRRRPRRELAVCAAAALLPLIAWWLLHAHWMSVGPLATLPDERSYLRYVLLDHPASAAAMAFRSLGSNSVEYALDLVGWLAGRPIPAGLAIAGLAAALVIGAVRQARRRPELVWTVAAYLAAVWLWPFTQDRLLLPVLPFAGLLAAHGLESALAARPARWRHAVYAALGLAAAGVGLRQYGLRRTAVQAALAGAAVRPIDDSPRRILLRNSAYALRVASWLRAHSTMEDRVLVEFPAAEYLYTGRLAIPSAPAELRFGVSTFAIPGGYLAGHILADSVTIVVVAAPPLPLARDVRAVQAVCPRVLQWAGDGPPDTFPALYRVDPDRTCLAAHWNRL